MTFQEEVNAAFKAVRNVQLDKESDDSLRSMVGALHRLKDSQHAPQATPAIDAIQSELARRDATARHKERISELQRLHQELLAETKGLQNSVRELDKPHWTMTPGFVVIALTMVFAAIAAWPVMREWIPAFRPVDRGSSFQVQQSNSTPMIHAVQKTSPVAPAVIQGTNQGQKN